MTTPLRGPGERGQRAQLDRPRPSRRKARDKVRTGRASPGIPPVRVISRQSGDDLSLTCRKSGLDLARHVSMWLGFASWAPGPSHRPGRPQERSGRFFLGVRADSPRKGFADLENRQRRKSLVGSNPTPSAFRFSGFVEGSALWRWLDTVPGNAWHRSPALTHRRPYCRGPEFLCPSGGPAGGSGLGPRCSVKSPNRSRSMPASSQP